VIVTDGVRDGCYLQVSEQTNDPTLCERIADPGLKSACTGTPVYVE